MHMRTTLDLPDALYKKVKRLARERKMPFRAVVAEALMKMLEQQPARRAYVLPDCSFRGDGLVEGLTDSDWERIRELAYEGRGGGRT